LREEEFGAIKTLKRLERTNPSVGIDGMNDYQAIYNKRWQNQSFLSVNVNHDEMLSFGWMID